MGCIIFINNTSRTIDILVTGDSCFYSIIAGAKDSWNRSHSMIAFIDKNDGVGIRAMKVTADRTYDITDTGVTCT